MRTARKPGSLSRDRLNPLHSSRRILRSSKSTQSLSKLFNRIKVALRIMNSIVQCTKLKTRLKPRYLNLPKIRKASQQQEYMEKASPRSANFSRIISLIMSVSAVRYCGLINNIMYCQLTSHYMLRETASIHQPGLQDSLNLGLDFFDISDISTFGVFRLHELDLTIISMFGVFRLHELDLTIIKKNNMPVESVWLSVMSLILLPSRGCRCCLVSPSNLVWPLRPWSPSPEI